MSSPQITNTTKPRRTESSDTEHDLCRPVSVYHHALVPTHQAPTINRVSEGAEDNESLSKTILESLDQVSRQEHARISREKQSTNERPWITS